jgi:glycine/D-amino acid oxidase-like deaminating enzyme
MRIAIIGAGVIGALTAYELSGDGSHSLTLLEAASEPATASSGAALGVMMGVISHKAKGRPWRLRRDSLERYETLIPELEQLTGERILFNRQGLVKPCYETDAAERWAGLIERRRLQGYPLDWLGIDELWSRHPQVGGNPVGAVVSPRDRQVDPAVLTRALVQAAIARGVTVRYGHPVTELQPRPEGVVVDSEPYDRVVICAGLGSEALSAQLGEPLPMQPVLGQALELHCPQPLGPEPEPVFTAEDIHLVPLGSGRYWLGATLELPEGPMSDSDRRERLAALQQRALEIWPGLATATVVRCWQGDRPRPVGRSAPVIERLEMDPRLVRATAHYRNGVLLAPGTAMALRALLTEA